MKEEFTLEVYDSKNEWMENAGVFSTYDEAMKYADENPLDNGDWYSIWCIEYDDNGNEVKSYPVYYKSKEEREYERD